MAKTNSTKTPQNYVKYYNNNNIKRTNNKQLTYICGDKSTPNDSPLGTSLRSIRDADTSETPKLDLIYKEARQKMRNQEKLFYISCSVSSKPRKRRKLNIDIIPEPGDKPSKYICSLAPYKHKHGVYQNIPTKTVNWSGWQKSKDLYSEYKGDAQFGKFVQRTTYTKTLSRTIAPGMLGGTILEGDTMYAVLFIYDKEYRIELDFIHDTITDKHGKSGVHYFAKGSYQAEWNDGEYDHAELDDMEELQ
jgi:hypothetical protein